MTNHQTQIGFSQRIRLEWLEETASLVLAKNNDKSIRYELHELLKDKLSVGRNTKRGSREKAITILMKIWVHPPHKLLLLQQEGLRLLSYLPQEEHIAVHWGMTMAVYPFWASVAAHVGRLLKLQGMATHAQVRRRVMEQFGQRPTVRDAVRRILRSMVDWGVLNDKKMHNAHNNQRTHGVYVPGIFLNINRAELIAWLVEAFLHTCPNGLVSLTTVIDSPSLFPFRLYPIPAAHLVTLSRQLDLLRHGLNEELIMLKQSM